MHGTPEYAENFPHLDYVSPDAPKGGELVMSKIGTFDSLNPFIVKGAPAAGTGLIYDTLLFSTADEPFTEYGYLAERIEIPEDRSWVIFHLRPEARFHDGKPVTAEDVIFSFNTLRDHGAPYYKAYYSGVAKAEALDTHAARFSFTDSVNNELPLILGQFPVLPAHYWQTDAHDFEETTLEPPPGSGPYKVAYVDAGREITYERVTDWWAQDLPLMKGQYNFDRITYKYYRDANVALEAFLAGDYDFRQENTAKLWATAYDAAPVKDGKIIKETIENSLPQGIQGFVYNTRRDVFADRQVRKALAYAFDFEWSNKQFAYDAYKRSRSYFTNSEMEAKGLPEGREREILERFRDQLPDEVFSQEYNPPSTDGSGQSRQNLREAIHILEAAGWMRGRNGIREKNGIRLSFEILETNPAFERWLMPFIQNLEKIGVEARLRLVDAAQYQNRMNTFDYDMTVLAIGQSNSPGNEQDAYWSSDKAHLNGSRNYMGIQDPVIDALIKMVISAPDRTELVARTRALDRVLQWGYYLIPNWHLAAWRVAYWADIRRPQTTPPYNLPVVSTWWKEGASAQTGK